MSPTVSNVHLKISPALNDNQLHLTLVSMDGLCRIMAQRQTPAGMGSISPNKQGRSVMLKNRFPVGFLLAFVCKEAATL